jgi:hypothetical protein
MRWEEAVPFEGKRVRAILLGKLSDPHDGILELYEEPLIRVRQESEMWHIRDVTSIELL